MADSVFKDSVYRFVDPIRYFKANDPYYWEVENIPLKQIHENVLWLKDQIGPQDRQFANVGRRDLAELKPYVNGEDNVVKVMPGRYTARINNAYSLDDKLQAVELMAGTGLGHLDRWKLKLLSSSDIQTVIAKVKKRTLDNYLGMNGLAERVFNYPTLDWDYIGEWVTASTGPHQSVTGPGGVGNTKRRGFPLTDGNQIADGVADGKIVRPEFEMDFPAEDIYGFYDQAYLSSHLIRRWRGVARTAVVDVPEELSIEIPSFNKEDYHYKDENGVKQLIKGVSNRIDLLFVYSKPVDTSSVYIGEYSTGKKAPTKITKAELGLVHGAGIGLNFEARELSDGHTEVPLQNSEGKSMIVPNASDQLMTDAGFKKIGTGVHGSFPAPDDLMNISPLLAEQVESDNPMLLGQSILPIAYIVTRSSDSVNFAGTNILEEDSIVDIRPFLRTTELSYNERAGITAAVPQLSNANPAVGKGQLDEEIRRIRDEHNFEVKELDNRLTNRETEKWPRQVATGYVFGGTLFGVESALIDAYRTIGNYGKTDAELQAHLINESSLPSDTELPSYPQWDVANWAAHDASIPSPGSFPCDWINTHVSTGGGVGVSFGSFINKSLTGRASHFGVDNTLGNYPTCIHYVSKKIWLNKNAVPWMGDYNVDVELWNCVPLSCRPTGWKNMAAGVNGVWIEKHDKFFMLYVAWVANDFIHRNDSHNEERYPELSGSSTYNTRRLDAEHWTVPRNNRDRGDQYAGFAVINTGTRWIGSGQIVPFKGATQAGVALYPTVSFTVTGIPKGFSGHHTGVEPGTAVRLY
tara:strand:- start:1031 stop:3445 length:2415 start_codon:yes stop_codon:yes gene_type:complete